MSSDQFRKIESDTHHKRSCSVGVLEIMVDVFYLEYLMTKDNLNTVLGSAHEKFGV